MAGPFCQPCEIVAQLIESYLLANHTVNEIVPEINKLCKYVPSLAVTCAAFVQYGITAAIQYIQANESPVQICSQIGQC
jgi:hypothetical protein